MYFSRNYRITKLLLLSFTAIIFLSCDQNKVIDEDKFIELYTDILIAKDTTAVVSQSKDSTVQIILRKHNITFDDYKTTVDYYNQESERWERFFNSAVTYLESKKKQVSEK
jgi:hypothetical protein